MVVLHVIRDLFARGGTPRKLLGLVRASAGSDVTHAFLVFDDHEDSLAASFEDAGAPVTRVARGRGVGLVPVVVRVARASGAAVISTHFARADILGGWASLLARLPLVKNVHGIIVNERPEVLAADRLLARRRAAVVCNSAATLRAQERLGLAERAVVVLNGVEAPPAASEGGRARVRGEMGFAAEDFVVGHVGGLIPSRDQTLLVEAVAVLRGLGLPARGLIVGDGPESDSLKSRIAASGMKGHVVLSGYRDDISDVLSAMDAYVNVSRSEGFGIAVVEAMQAGLPTVVADAGALPEVVTHAVDGVVVPAGDAEALAEALSALIRDEGLRIRLGRAARLTAAERFSVARYASELNAVYRSAASSRRD